MALSFRVMKALLDWFDRRTGYRRIIEYSLYENIPGGARWRYVWGSTLVFCLSVQFLTGLVLWMSYNPSSQTALESVYYIQNEMTGGWLLRGIHHFTASVMNVLLVLHLMQVVIDGAYRAPREINFWFGLGLLQLVLALSLTGYLLPWDQKGYWATKVATNIMGIVPGVGSALQRLVIGGPDYGHHTLTRFFALHAGVLPACVVMLLVWHIFLFRRHGITAKDPKRKPDEYFFPGGTEIWGAIVIPGFIMLIIFLMPIIGRWNLGHRFNVGLSFSLLGGVLFLTFLAMTKDKRDPAFKVAVEEARRNTERVKALAQAPEGIP